MERRIKEFQELVKLNKAHPGDVDLIYSLLPDQKPNLSFDEKVMAILNYT